MSALSWKSLPLFGTILVIAFGLELGAIKMVMDLNEEEKPALPETGTPATTRSGTPAETSPAPPAPAHPSPEAALTPNPEANLISSETHVTPALPSPVVQPGTDVVPPPTPSKPTNSIPTLETQTLLPPNSAMVSNIPPPIELEPEPTAPTEEAATPAVTAPPVEPQANLPITPATTPAPVIADEPAGTLLEPSTLKGRDPQHYTVQLYSGKDMDKLRTIAKSITKAKPLAYFVTASRSGPWYSLVVGDYADLNAAQAAATQIAAESSVLKPWIRRFSEIQARMR